VTGGQTCALPISELAEIIRRQSGASRGASADLAACPARGSLTIVKLLSQSVMLPCLRHGRGPHRSRVSDGAGVPLRLVSLVEARASGKEARRTGGAAPIGGSPTRE